MKKLVYQTGFIVLIRFFTREVRLGKVWFLWFFRGLVKKKLVGVRKLETRFLGFDEWKMLRSNGLDQMSVIHDITVRFKKLWKIRFYFQNGRRIGYPIPVGRRRIRWTLSGNGDKDSSGTLHSGTLVDVVHGHLPHLRRPDGHRELHLLRGPVSGMPSCCLTWTPESWN